LSFNYGNVNDVPTLSDVVIVNSFPVIEGMTPSAGDVRIYDTPTLSDIVIVNSFPVIEGMTPSAGDTEFYDVPTLSDIVIVLKSLATEDNSIVEREDQITSMIACGLSADANDIGNTYIVEREDQITSMIACGLSADANDIGNTYIVEREDQITSMMFHIPSYTLNTYVNIVEREDSVVSMMMDMDESGDDNNVLVDVPTLSDIVIVVSYLTEPPIFANMNATEQADIMVGSDTEYDNFFQFRQDTYADNIPLLIEQYHNSTNLKKLLEIELGGLDEIVTVASQIDRATSMTYSGGVNLDNRGVVYNELRNGRSDTAYRQGLQRRARQFCSGTYDELIAILNSAYPGADVRISRSTTELAAIRIVSKRYIDRDLVEPLISAGTSVSVLVS